MDQGLQRELADIVLPDAGFDGIEWLVITAIGGQDPTRAASFVNRVIPQLADSAASHDRMTALADMTALIGSCGPSRFAGHLERFFGAGMTGAHLQLLAAGLTHVKPVKWPMP